MSRQRVDGYLIKYALTEGIRKVEGATLVDGKYVSFDGFFVRYGRDFVRTREEAEAAARAMAVRKIKALENQITKLRILASESKWWKEQMP